MKSKKLFAIATVALVTMFSACGSSDSQNTTDALFNDADVMFAQMMIPHHEQAIEMSDMALDPTMGAVDPIRELATQIKNAQDPEIKQMKDLLEAWNEPQTADSGVDHSSMMSGMMSSDELTKLGSMMGSEFDTAWAKAMIAHHEGAIDMANTVLADGKNSEILILAQEIISSQQTEIDTLKSLISQAK